MNDLKKPNNLENDQATFEKANENPLSIRVDPYYKSIFNTIIKDKGMSKKALLENMIHFYTENDLQKNKDENINFSNDLSLLSVSLDEILLIFKKMIEKSQDTIGSIKEDYKQKIDNRDVSVKALEDTIYKLEEKNKLLENKIRDLELENENLNTNIKDFEEKMADIQNEKSIFKEKNSELLENLNKIRNIEIDNHILYEDKQKLLRDIESLKGNIDTKDNKIEKLENKIVDLKTTIDEIKYKFKEEFNDVEYRIKKEAEIEKKTELLQMHTQYNDLQKENIKNLGLLNQKSEEISRKNIQIENLELKIEKILKPKSN